MTDPAGESSLAALDAERERVRSLVAGQPMTVLETRPANGTWSPLEHTRHLLFAAQSHLGRFAPGGRQYSALGLAPDGMQGNRNLAHLGSVAIHSIEQVLAEWDAFYESVRPGLLAEPASAARALDRHLRHLRAHRRAIERALREGQATT